MTIKLLKKRLHVCNFSIHFFKTTTCFHKLKQICRNIFIILLKYSIIFLTSQLFNYNNDLHDEINNLLKSIELESK